MAVLNIMNKFYRQPGKDPFIKIPSDATTAQFGHLNAIVDELNNSGSNYKVYVAALTQLGTDDPVANVFVNTLGVDITWTRIAEGAYEGTPTTPVFAESNTFLSIFKNITLVDETKTIGIGYRNKVSYLRITCIDSTQTAADIDGVVFIEVRVYNL